MTAIPEPTLHDLLWAIAKAEVECKHPDMLQASWCKQCHGTGRVPRFPELRVECPHESSHGSWARAWRGIECSCHGLGFVPLWSKPEDLATWIRVLELAISVAEPGGNLQWDWDTYASTGSILGAFTVATEALGIEVRQEASP